MVEPRSMERWFAMEMTHFHRAFVPRPRPLHELVQEEEPSATTRGGDTHRFDPATLRRIHDALPPLARRRARLPITFYVDKDAADDAHIADEAAMDVLRALGEVPPDAAPREGRLWLGHARARLVAQRYPGAFQFVYH